MLTFTPHSEGAMQAVRTTCLILLLAASHAQTPKAPPCNGSTVDNFDPAIADSSQAFVVELQKLVHANDKRAIASRINYPLRVNQTIHGKLTHTLIRNPQQFIAAYDSLFNDKVRSAILSPASVECLFANDQGFMIGDGEIWFQQAASKAFRIFALNP